MSSSRPPYDWELEPVLAKLSEIAPLPVTIDRLGALRDSVRSAALPIEDVIGERPIRHVEHVIPGPAGQPEVTVSIFSRFDRAAGGPGILYIHGGGMVIGSRFTGVGNLIDWIYDLDAIGISVEYRLAPESPDPAPVEDCYASLVWAASHADTLGFDPAQLFVAGASAGAGLAAGVALLARDRGGPVLAGQLLIYPMLDDRSETVSSRQYVNIGVWDQESVRTGWNSLLGSRRSTDQVSIYAAPARSNDLSLLPPAYIEVGSAEVFRDEDVAYASAIWAAGGQAELHVWPGAFHGSDSYAPNATLSTRSKRARIEWLTHTVRRLAS